MSTSAGLPSSKHRSVSMPCSAFKSSLLDLMPGSLRAAKGQRKKPSLSVNNLLWSESSGNDNVNDNDRQPNSHYNYVDFDLDVDKDYE